MQRRKFLRWMALSGSAAFQPAVLFNHPTARAQSNRTSHYGHWELRNNLPAFVYDVDQNTLPEWDPLIGPPETRKTRRNWLMVGNQAIQLQAANDGTVALFDETYGLRWLTAPDPSGTGVTVIDDGDKQWGSEFSLRAGQSIPLRTFGPTWFEVKDAYAGLSLTRTILCPEGEVPWVLVHVQLALSGDATRTRAIRHTERWALRPRFLDTLELDDLRRPEQVRRERAQLAVTYTVGQSAAGLVAAEQFASVNEPGPLGEAARHLIGLPAVLVLERLADTPGIASHRFEGSSRHPILEIGTSMELEPGQTRDLWFRFGRQDNTTVPKPDSLLNGSLIALSQRLPTAAAQRAPEAAQEVPWHAVLLTGGVAVDRVMGGHTCNQASAYSFVMGFNGAARDPLQHALPLVYTQPDLALSVLRNTCAWALPTGELPYALDGAKKPTGLKDYLLVSKAPYRPSDSNIWVLWLAAEYAAATGDLAAFDAPLPYHPIHNTNPVPLREHLRRQFQYFVKPASAGGVGRGEMGHVRIMHADWNDLAITITGAAADQMIATGGSVLNSAMAAWVLSVFAALATRLGETAMETEALKQADDLRGRVRDAWNGRWFNRAYAPGGGVIGGRDDMWLEVQPWAILCGAANENQTKSLLQTIADEGPGNNSPLGTRVRWRPGVPFSFLNAQSIWYSINMTLIWAAARVRPEWAWDQWRRMTLSNHTANHPGIWEGTLSGPDAWNPPESGRDRVGRTWSVPFLPISMQPFPVNNLHSHSQPLLAYLRLLGVEPTPRGTLAVGKGGDFQSEVFHLDREGHGSLQARGAASLETIHGTVSGGPGKIGW